MRLVSHEATWSSVPTGHTQPQNARPKSTVSATTAIAIASPAGSSHDEARTASAASGFSSRRNRTGKRGIPMSVMRASEARKKARKKPW
jgi:hypothetical protein